MVPGHSSVVVVAAVVFDIVHAFGVVVMVVVERAFGDVHVIAAAVVHVRAFVVVVAVAAAYVD